VWGRQSCLQVTFQAAVNSEQITYGFARIFSGFVSRSIRGAKPEKFVSKQEGGLKTRLHATNGRPTKRQRRVGPLGPTPWALAFCVGHASACQPALAGFFRCSVEFLASSQHDP